MANRLKINEMDKVLGYAEAHIEQQNFEGAVVVLHAAMKQLVATLAGEDMNNQSDPDITIYTNKECMVSIDDIKEICAKTIGVTIKELESRKRTQNVSLARQCAVYFSRKQGYGVEELGKVFNRNHSNISHTCRAIRDMLECDPEMAAKINLVGRNINGQN
jgi:chromosomal replication initiator protein